MPHAQNIPALCCMVLFFACTTTTPLHAQLPADEAPAARATLNAVFDDMTAIRNDLSQITKAAELAAARYIRGAELGVCGDDGLRYELAERAGGLASYHGKEGNAGDVILFVLGLNRRDQPDGPVLIRDQLAQATALRQAGAEVIGIASVGQLKKLKLHDAAQDACSIVLDNHAADPAQASVNNAIVAWCWQVEFFAACSRQGRTPVMRQSFETDYRQRRYKRYHGLRYHRIDEIKPAAPGELGDRYLRELHGILLDVSTASWDALAGTSHRAADIIHAGHRVFVRAGTPYLSHHYGPQLADVPQVFLPLDHDGSNHNLPSPTAQDMVIAFGHCDPPGTGWWGEPELFRRAGDVTWVISAYHTKPGDLAPGERLIDQYWPEGDALIKPPGYDIHIGPASGIVSVAIYHALTAETAHQLQNHRTNTQGNAQPSTPGH